MNKGLPSLASFSYWFTTHCNYPWSFCEDW